MLATARWCLLVIGLFGCGGAGLRASGPGPTAWRYRASVDAGLRGLVTTVCFDGAAPRWLAPVQPEAIGLVTRARSVGRGAPRPLAVTTQGIDLSALGADQCVEYRIDLVRAESLGGWGRAATLGWDRTERVGRDLVTSARTWLWAPRPRPPDAVVTLELELPAGVAVSAPWPSTRPGHFQIAPSTFQWPSRIAFGRFSVQRIVVPGGVLEVALLDHPMRASQEGIARWLRTAAGAVASLYGGFPQPRTQVLLDPVAAPGRPVIFGVATRGGGAAVFLVPSSLAEDEDFARDWVAVHELTHLGMPFVRREESWLSEGFATYYGEVLRARAGLHSAGDAWRSLQQGFERGRNDGVGQTLAGEAALMRQTGAYMRVYWGGAAIALLSDVAIRRRSLGARSLDTAMRALRRCCLDSTRIWPADELLARVSASEGGRELRAVAARLLQDRHMPVLDGLYRRLGIDRRTDDAPPEAWLRDAIMREVRGVEEGNARRGGN